MALSIACPLCSQPGFSDVNSLWLTLIRATTRQLTCPVCHEVLCGLDKLTIHLVSHSLHDQWMQTCLALNLMSPPAGLCKNNYSLDASLASSSTTSQNTAHSDERAPYVIIDIPVNQNLQDESQSQSNLPKSVESTARISRGNEEISDSVPTRSQEMCLPTVISHGPTHSTIEAPQNAISEASSPPKLIALPLTLKNEENESILSNILSAPVEGTSCLSQIPEMAEHHSSSGEFLQNSSSTAVPCLTGTSPSPSPESQQNDVSDHGTWEPEVSCGLCDLSFKDKNVATLHQQLIHCNNQPQQPSLNENERSCPKHCKVKRNFGCQTQTRGVSGPLHKFPCHICNKVFRMRGSLMVHLRVAHSPTGIANLAARISGSSTSTESQIADVTYKIPMQNLTLNESNLTVSSGAPLRSTSSFQSKVNLPAFHNQGNSECASFIGKHQHDQKSTVKDSISSRSPTRATSASLSPSEALFAQLSPNEVGAMIFPCNLCNKTYTKETLLNQHLKSHESKQWECDVCFKSFTTKYFLKKHKRLHTGEMPYTCAICNKSFTFQQSYHKHLLYHSDEKPHSCSECGRAFKELSTLHNHQRIHTGEKPWACETCDVVGVFV